MRVPTSIEALLTGTKEIFDKAIRDYSMAIKLEPKTAEAYSNRGNAYGEKGDFNRAIQDYNKLVELDPRNAKALF